MGAIDKKKEARASFLVHLYDRTDGVELELVSMYEVGALTGLSRDETESVVDYLVGEGLIEFAALGGVIRITHYGVVEAEQASS
jgi:hypothetical protein